VFRDGGNPIGCFGRIKQIEDLRDGLPIQNAGDRDSVAFVAANVTAHAATVRVRGG
jgi:hypothetical protein